MSNAFVEDPEVLRLLPGLVPGAFRITSAETAEYNCIAWAAGDTSRWWWPTHDRSSYWPANVECDETMAAFISAFATLGYSQAIDAAVEAGVEKIALFATAGAPSHAARQLASGRWTSKLGAELDLEHELYAIEGPLCGKVTSLLGRRRP